MKLTGKAAAVLAVFLMGTAAWGASISVLRRQAETGDPAAQNTLALAFCEAGARQNYNQAAYWFRKAAEQGYADAMFNLGSLYHNGWGVGKDLGKALNWYRKAIAKGHLGAKNTLGTLYEAEETSTAIQEAARLYREAGEQGFAAAQGNLGRMLLFGAFDRRGDTVIEPDVSSAASWVYAAAEQNDPQGQWLMGYMYEHGYGVEQNADLAQQWYAAAAAQGYTAQ